MANDRTIRVFVSSTFRDMQAERDELVLRVFPQLRKLCDERGVTWGEVDLRWGITEEQTQRGETLPICLEEIKRCRPYFIGLLGERYGWIPDHIPPEIIEREPWLREHVESKRSITDLEIMHGVLNNPDMADHAFFYFRDPAYLDKVSEELRGHFTAEDAESAEKLRRLKERLRDSDVAWNDNYPDPETLGQWVLADLTQLINQRFPPGSKPDSLTRERMDHEAFARSRASVYIGRQEYFDRLDAHVADHGPPLVVLGESGGGKSALLSNWALRYREQHPDDFLLLHFIGGSPDSANATGILRRIMLELKERFELPDDLPAQPELIREAFPTWLAQTAGSGRVVLVLDALNQLEDIDNAPDLGWLPRVFPRNCRFILSTLPGRSLDAVQQRGWLETTLPLEVLPLDEEERRRLIHDFLRPSGRDLGPARTQRVVGATQTSNPLYLRVLLDELRTFGVHEQLDERVDWYLEAGNPEELYRKVITRWEEAYAENTDLVSDVLSLLWAARRGLSESELLEALGQDGRPLPHAVWSPLYLAMSDALVNRNGLLTFAHDFLRTAVREAYLSTQPQQQAAHRRLAEYLQQSLKLTDRGLDELPWQLQRAEVWEQLKDLLTDMNVFHRLRSEERWKQDLQGYWLALKPHYDPCDAYLCAINRWETESNNQETYAVRLNDLAVFHNERAEHNAAEPLYRRALAIDEQSYGAAHHRIAIRLNNLAELLRDTNRLAEAEPLIRRALAIDEQSFGAEHPNVATALSNLAALLQDTNRLAEAEPLMARVVTIFEKFLGKDHPNVATALSNLAALLQDTNRLAEAEPLIRRALAIDEKSFGAEHPTVAIRLSNLATLLQDTNRLAEAEPLMARVVTILEKSLGEDHPNVATALGNLASLLQATNRLAEAEPLMRPALAIDQQVYGAEHPNVAIGLNNLAQLLQATNRLTEAEPMLRRVLAIWEQSLGTEHPQVAAGLNNLAVLLQATNRLAEAEPLIRRALAIDEKSFGAEHPTVAIRLNNLAVLLQDTNRLAEAEPLMRRMVEILVKFTAETGHQHPQLQRLFDNYAGHLQAMGWSYAEIERRLNEVLAQQGMPPT